MQCLNMTVQPGCFAVGLDVLSPAFVNPHPIALLFTGPGLLGTL